MAYIPRSKNSTSSSFPKKSFGAKPRPYGKPVSSGGAGARRPSTSPSRPFTPKKGASAPSRAVPPKVAVPSPTPSNQHFKAAAAAKRQQAFERQGAAPKKPAAPERKFPPRAEQKFTPKTGASAAYKGGARKPVASAPYRGKSSNPEMQPTSSKAAFSKPKAAFRLPASPKKFSVPKAPRTSSASFESKNPTTSWGSVASWYDKHLSEDDTYHQKVILPNLLRLVEPRRGAAVVDLACGSGYFAKAFAQEGAVVTGIDISEELIAIARRNTPAVSYHVGRAEDCPIISTQTKDKVVIVLAIQNIEHVQKVFIEAARMLKSGGTVHLVLNHPAFRIPKQSAWEYDDKKKVQYRRVDQYMSESTSAIDMHPGMPDSPQTISFHRPLQYYFKALAKAGFAVDRFEEWISHKDSDSGPRARAENVARKEIPLFLYMRAKKNSAD